MCTGTGATTLRDTCKSHVPLMSMETACQSNLRRVVLTNGSILWYYRYSACPVPRDIQMRDSGAWLCY